MQKIISHQFNQSMQTLLRYHCAKAKVTLEYSQEYQRTAILTLNNASKRNTLCLETLHQLQDKLQ